MGQDGTPEDSVRKFISVWNTHDLNAIGPLLDPALVFYSPLFPDGVRGIEARKKNG